MKHSVKRRWAACLVVVLLAGLGGTLLVQNLAFAADAPKPIRETKPLLEKTLVAWVYVTDSNQQGGSVLTLIDKAEHFDAIVLGEVARGKWMAGSDFFRRTQQDQASWPLETAGANTLVQLAITYHGDRVTLFRNAKEYAAYSIGQAQSFGDDAMVLLGLRYIGETGEIGYFTGAIEEVRIYDTALNAQQIGALAPNQSSDPKPLAWWTFEDGRADDLMKRFPASRLGGNARVADGKLILDGSSYLWAATDAKLLTTEQKTPPQDAVYSRAAEGTYTVPPELKHFRLLSSTPIKIGNAEAAGYDITKWQSDPSRIIYHDGKYHVWMIDGYLCYDQINKRPENGLSWIRHLNSKDGKTWNAVSYVPLGPKGSCYDLAIEQANVIMHEGRFYLFSEALTTHTDQYKSMHAGIVCLVADAPEGPWKQVGDLMLRPENDGRSFDSMAVVNPRHVFFQGKWLMYYKGDMGKAGEPTKNGVAIADSLTGPYRKCESNPLLHGHGHFAWRYKHGIIMVMFDAEFAGQGTKNNSRLLWTEDGIHFVPLAESEGLFLFGSLYCPSDPLFGKPVTDEPTTKYWGLQSVHHGGTTGWDVERIEWQFGSASSFETREAQAMFFRTGTTGRGWDTWWFHHDGTYYQYILSGPEVRWTGVTLITSQDGCHWKNRGVVLTRTPEAVYLGSGGVWKSANFEQDGRFIMNFSEQYPPNAGRWPNEQVICFAESKDLVHWKRLPDEFVFRADERWYERLGSRWDCIYAIPRGDGGYFGYWTGFPKSGSGRAFGQSDDGLHWEALKPVECPGQAEVAAVEPMAGKYYMISQARLVFVADRPEGPFRPAAKNHDLMSGAKLPNSGQVVTPFPRFFRKGKEVFITSYAIAVHESSLPTYCLPLNVADVDEEGTLRATYWKGNDAMKERSVPVQFIDADLTSPQMIEQKIAVREGCILEATGDFPAEDANCTPCVFIDGDNGERVAIQVHANGKVEMGVLSKDGRTLDVRHRVNRQIAPGKSPGVRLMLKESLFAFYLNDVLMDYFPMSSLANGQLGVSSRLRDVRVWTTAPAF